MEELKPYYVLTPEYSSDWGWDEPPEYGCDVVAVMAFDEQDAKVRGVKAMRNSKYCKYIKDDPGANPFAELTVNPAFCEHGVWLFTDASEDGIESGPDFECEKCLEEWRKDATNI